MAQVVNKYVIVYKQNGATRAKQVARVLSFSDSERKITYELLTGKEKGRKFESKCDAAVPVKVYEEEDLTIALLEV